MNYKIIFLLLLLITGCSKRNYSLEECEQFSMDSFKGIPRAAHNFKTYCTKYKIKYTHELCQEALTYLITTAKVDKVTLKYGKPITNCFTKDDIQKFSN